MFAYCHQTETSFDKRTFALNGYSDKSGETSFSQSHDNNLRNYPKKPFTFMTVREASSKWNKLVIYLPERKKYCQSDLNNYFLMSTIFSETLFQIRFVSES